MISRINKTAPVSSSHLYIGRFAPSPTGPLHFGSLVAALGSYLDARARNGRWLVRIEDLDTPRNRPGAADAILRALDALGLRWDGEVLYQSARREQYIAVLERLKKERRLFECACTRAEVGDKPYPGTCRRGLPPGRRGRSLRLRLPNEPLSFTDALQGEFTQHLQREAGDTILKRADGVIAYHLAVVVDDAAQDITDIVRGADLLDSTPRQIYLQRLLGLATPRYLHLPVALGADGRKLSKQNGATAIDTTQAGALLCHALQFLGQMPPGGLETASASDVLAWAGNNWMRASVPVKGAITIG
ncbi:MAG TPA: tRNA glutamyl-Q(34) synthetase GluQRS [Gammaproteobacteria bacterium]|nr:tRNA glutamyl-Q(34) synthetase GluQRS [Gammaproteobacteria bacterium]